jgi:hypothetical protein
MLPRDVCVLQRCNADGETSFTAISNSQRVMYQLSKSNKNY